MDHIYWLLTSFHCVKITINFFSMVFDFASIAFNGFRWFRTIGLAIAEMIGQLLTLTIWSNLDKFHYILGGSILSFSWKSEALTASVANFSVFTQPNIWLIIILSYLRMSQDVHWGCPRTSNRDVLRESVTERHWSFPVQTCRGGWKIRHRWKVLIL